MLFSSLWGLYSWHWYKCSYGRAIHQEGGCLEIHPSRQGRGAQQSTVLVSDPRQLPCSQYQELTGQGCWCPKGRHSFVSIWDQPWIPPDCSLTPEKTLLYQKYWKPGTVPRDSSPANLEVLYWQTTNHLNSCQNCCLISQNRSFCFMPQ